jgi:hypothetical protein
MKLEGQILHTGAAKCAKDAEDKATRMRFSWIYVGFHIRDKKICVIVIFAVYLQLSLMHARDSGVYEASHVP